MNELAKAHLKQLGCLWLQCCSNKATVTPSHLAGCSGSGWKELILAGVLDPGVCAGAGSVCKKREHIFFFSPTPSRLKYCPELRWFSGDSKCFSPRCLHSAAFTPPAEGHGNYPAHSPEGMVKILAVYVRLVWSCRSIANIELPKRSVPPSFFPCCAITFPLCHMSCTNPTCLVPSAAKINSSSHFVLLAMLLIRPVTG